jgi:hypothetical protein
VFERKIASRLRRIYDTPELLAELDGSTPKTRPGIVKRSVVQRGQQGGGAKAPDVVTPTTWWLELQWAQPGKGRADCSDKLEQAERDVNDMPNGSEAWRPAVIWAKKGSPIINVTLRAMTLMSELCDRSYWIPAGGQAELARSMPAIISFEDFVKLLERDHDRSRARWEASRQGTKAS